jgi:hypothetical protein
MINIGYKGDNMDILLFVVSLMMSFLFVLSAIACSVAGYFMLNVMKNKLSKKEKYRPIMTDFISASSRIHV